ncbi:hypothetical protein [Anabaena sp. CS-542/02]|nr:hypothetical protein [Anabaena sp. CS-542/02]MDB9445384.1 hypothetical protein [Anabaena sp. CS-542/02]
MTDKTPVRSLLFVTHIPEFSPSIFIEVGDLIQVMLYPLGDRIKST